MRATFTPGAARESASGWCLRDDLASSPDEKDPFFDPAADKVYRHPTFYQLPEEVQDVSEATVAPGPRAVHLLAAAG